MILVFSFMFYCFFVSDPGIATPVASSVYSDDMFPLLAREGDVSDLCPRRHLEIIWSCVTTILAASWVSVHPNLPHPQDSKLKKTLRRVELMFWAIITPELIIFWAMRQWHGARKMEKEFLAYLSEKQENTQKVTLTGKAGFYQGTYQESNFNDFKWTRTHGFFLQMGGFVLQRNGKTMGVLGWKPLMQHYKDGKINLSDVTETSINDHSKADGLAKGLALLQTSWFIIQCIARFANPALVLTELELVTAALAVLSLVMYFLWWNKPFNAEVPILINVLDAEAGFSHDNPTPQEPYADIQETSNVMCLQNIFVKIFKPILDRVRDIISDYGDETYDVDPLDNLRVPVMKAPTFYSINTGLGVTFIQIMWACISISALFGAIHCAGWSSKIRFSSHTTLLLWRISATIITGSPLVWGLIFVFAYAEQQSEDESLSKEVYDKLSASFTYLSILTIPLYIFARIILLVLAFVELRDLPPGSLATIQWASFVPFIH